MKTRMRFLVLVASLGCAVAGCGPADNNEDGTGGATGSGGQTGSGGATGSGGSGSGGATGSGGSGSGGATGSGGSGSGGVVSGSGGHGSGGTGSGGNASGGSAGGGSTGTGGGASGGAATGGSTAGGHGGGASGGNGGRGGSASGSGGSAGGNAGGSTGGGGNSGGTFNPCPTNGDPCRILPVGDSITFGINYEGAWRPEIFHRALMAGQKITFTGTLQNGPTMVDGMPFPRRYEATSGITIDGISNQITKNKTLDMPADIIMVHIGTNDIANNLSGSGDRLGKLLDKLIAGMPNALIVVAKIIPFTNAAQYNAMIPGVVQTRVAAGKHIIIVDLFTDFPKGDMDAIHPYQSGYNWMGDKFYESVASFLPK